MGLGRTVSRSFLHASSFEEFEDSDLLGAEFCCRHKNSIGFLKYELKNEE